MSRPAASDTEFYWPPHKDELWMRHREIIGTTMKPKALGTTKRKKNYVRLPGRVIDDLDKIFRERYFQE